MADGSSGSSSSDHTDRLQMHINLMLQSVKQAVSGLGYSDYQIFEALQRSRMDPNLAIQMLIKGFHDMAIGFHASDQHAPRSAYSVPNMGQHMMHQGHQMVLPYNTGYLAIPNMENSMATGGVLHQASFTPNLTNPGQFPFQLSGTPLLPHHMVIPVYDPNLEQRSYSTVPVSSNSQVMHNLNYTVPSSQPASFGDITVDEFVNRYYEGSFAKPLRLFGELAVLGSKRKGLKLLCQSYRYVIRMFRDKKMSWGGAFSPTNMRVIGNRRFQVDLTPSLPATTVSLLADLLLITDSMSGYFMLEGNTAIYVKHLFEFCQSLCKSGARHVDDSQLLDRSLNFIYNHPCFGFSTERADLFKGIGMTLKCCSTSDIKLIEQSMAKVHTGLDDWRKEVLSVPVLKDVFWDKMPQERVEMSNFRNFASHNFLFCRHALEHGSEKTLIKIGVTNNYQMKCPMCKTTYQKQTSAKASFFCSIYPWNFLEMGSEKYQQDRRDDQPDKPSDDSSTQIQPLRSPWDLDLLVGHVFDKFLSQSVFELLLESNLDRNPFIYARWNAFTRSIQEELEEDEDEEKSAEDYGAPFAKDDDSSQHKCEP